MTWDEMWEQSFIEAIADVEKRSQSNPTDWRVGGRATKANPDKENKVWWDENGRKMFYDFINAWQESGFSIWQTDSGVPGIEIEFNADFDGVPIKAFADLVAVTGGGELAVIDFKTGSSMPNSSMQLGVYAACMEKVYGIRPQRGFYYDARNKEFKEAFGLERWTIPVLTEMFKQFVKGLENEIFLPNLGMACSTCGVKEYCYAYGGQLSEIYDPLANIK